MFDPLRATALPIWRQDHAEYAAFYAPGCLCVVARSDADRFEGALVFGAQNGGFTERSLLGSQLGMLCDLGRPAEVSTPGTLPQTESGQGRSLLGALETATHQVDWVAELCRSARQALARSARMHSLGIAVARLRTRAEPGSVPAATVPHLLVDCPERSSNTGSRSRRLPSSGCLLNAP